MVLSLPALLIIAGVVVLIFGPTLVGVVLIVVGLLLGAGVGVPRWRGRRGGPRR